MEDSIDTDEQMLGIETPVALGSSQRQSKPNRRSTFLVPPPDQSEPPVDNPNNTPERNRQLIQEYEALRSINSTLETVIENIGIQRTQYNEFAQNVARTDALLNMWSQIVQRAEETKKIIEDPDWCASKAEKRKASSNDGKEIDGGGGGGGGVRRRRMIE